MANDAIPESMTKQQYQFNFAQKKTRVVVECTNGLLKKKIGMLSQEVRISY
jgi:hypothetical protein